MSTSSDSGASHRWSDAFFLLDGPMGTELERRGVETALPLWSATALTTRPDLVARIHREYAAAGATVHTANTFRTNPRHAGANWREWTRRAVTLAREAVPPGHRVAGSVAPVEDCYRPDLSPGEGARAEHREFARALVDAGVDLLLCETHASAVEARVAVEEAVRTGKETWASLTAGPDAKLMTPLALEDAARACAEAGARAVLVNCVAASRTLPYVERLARVGVPFGAYANAGDVAERMGWGSETDEGVRTYAECARAWRKLGASIVGGCCGTGPRHIAAVLEGP
jgi:S-methylmethionine-dependent homocysteine/selenocysteine methylase